MVKWLEQSQERKTWKNKKIDKTAQLECKNNNLPYSQCFILTESGRNQIKSLWHFLSFPPNRHLTRSHLPSSNAECAVLPHMGPSGIVMAVDEIWLEHRGNEKSACYGAIMVYSTLDACPMGLFSFCHIPCSISLSIPLSGCCTILEPTMETPPNSILDWWNDKTESGRCRKIVGQKKEKERTKGRRLDLNKILLSSAWCASLLLPQKLCIQKHARTT